MACRSFIVVLILVQLGVLYGATDICPSKGCLGATTINSTITSQRFNSWGRCRASSITYTFSNNGTCKLDNFVIWIPLGAKFVSATGCVESKDLWRQSWFCATIVPFYKPIQISLKQSQYCKASNYPVTISVKGAFPGNPVPMNVQGGNSWGCFGYPCSICKNIYGFGWFPPDGHDEDDEDDDHSHCNPKCENNGECVKGECDCSGTGYEGPACETPICDIPCSNDGKCIGPNECDCSATGHAGLDCSEAICTDPCLNAGKCVTPDVCDCNGTAYEGPTCSTPICEDQCLNNGECVSPNQCDCTGTGYNGSTCATPICKDECLNKGECVSPDKCDCTGTGYTGDTCSDPICNDECLNKGKCVSPDKCDCTGTGYTGSQCETSTCTPACQHGVCSSPNICTCDSEYTGVDCSEPITTSNCTETCKQVSYSAPSYPAKADYTVTAQFINDSLVITSSGPYIKDSIVLVTLGDVMNATYQWPADIPKGLYSFDTTKVAWSDTWISPGCTKDSFTNPFWTQFNNWTTTWPTDCSFNRTISIPYKQLSDYLLRDGKPAFSVLPHDNVIDVNFTVAISYLQAKDPEISPDFNSVVHEFPFSRTLQTGVDIISDLIAVELLTATIDSASKINLIFSLFFTEDVDKYYIDTNYFTLSNLDQTPSNEFIVDLSLTPRFQGEIIAKVISTEAKPFYDFSLVLGLRACIVDNSSCEIHTVTILGSLANMDIVINGTVTTDYQCVGSKFSCEREIINPTVGSSDYLHNIVQTTNVDLKFSVVSYRFTPASGTEIILIENDQIISSEYDPAVIQNEVGSIETSFRPGASAQPGAFKIDLTLLVLSTSSPSVATTTKRIADPAQDELITLRRHGVLSKASSTLSRIQVDVVSGKQDKFVGSSLFFGFVAILGALAGLFVVLVSVSVFITKNRKPLQHQAGNF